MCWHVSGWYIIWPFLARYIKLPLNVTLHIKFQSSLLLFIPQRSNILTQSTIQHSQSVSVRPLPTISRANSILYSHFIFHLVILWFSDRQRSGEMVFFFKEEGFQLSIRYLYLRNNIYNIIRHCNSSNYNLFLSAFHNICNNFVCFTT
jgi:hypothetical protein